MELVLLLIVVPLISAILVAVFPVRSVRNIVIRVSFVLISAISLYLLVTMLKSDTVYYTFNSHLVSRVMFIIEAAIAVFIIILGIKHRKFLAIIFVTIQFGLISFYEYEFPGHSDSLPSFFIDKLSIIMALIIGIIGGLICIYAIGYMRDYHAHHKEIKDRQPIFFFIIYVFLAAMFGIVFLNKLPWLFFCWEITTLCSFLLIGYSRTQEATDNAFLALTMNLAGGIAFALAIVWLASLGVPTCLNELIKSPKGVVMIPVALICFAGITKSAQLPFSFMAPWSNGCSNSDISTASFEYNGKGRCLYNYQAIPAVKPYTDRQHGMFDWGCYIPFRRLYCGISIKRQKDTRVVNGFKSWIDCGLRRNRDMGNRMGCHFSNNIPCCSKIFDVPLRRYR